MQKIVEAQNKMCGLFPRLGRDGPALSFFPDIQAQGYVGNLAARYTGERMRWLKQRNL
jgi:hypothetical protein